MRVCYGTACAQVTFREIASVLSETDPVNSLDIEISATAAELVSQAEQTEKDVSRIKTACQCLTRGIAEAWLSRFYRLLPE